MPSISIPFALVFSFIVSTLSVPFNSKSPVSPVAKNVTWLVVLSFISKSVKLPCLVAETKFVDPTA